MSTPSPDTPQTPAPTPTPEQPAPQQVQYIVQQQSLEGVSGWLIFWLVIFILNAISSLWMFFLSLIGVIEGGLIGIPLALGIESIIFSIFIAASASVAAVFIALRKKLAVLFSYIALAVPAIYITIISVTAMFATTEKCSYDYGSAGSYLRYSYERTCEDVALPAGAIIALAGAITVSWLATFFFALYFKLSKRVKQTLVR